MRDVLLFTLAGFIGGATYGLTEHLLKRWRRP